MTDMTVANTILSQMGGAGRLAAMTGAKHFAGSENKVSFQFKGSRKANAVSVELEPSDTYRVKFFKINARKLDLAVVNEVEGVYHDQLVPIFERTTGLYLSL